MSAKRLLSILFAAAPFAFGLIRFVQTGHDARMLWMALASGIGAAAVIMIARGRSRRMGVAALSAIVLAVATLLAAAAAYLLGARAAAGVWLVALVLALCWTASYVLSALAGPRGGRDHTMR